VPTTRIPGFVLTDHVVELPLDHAAPDNGHTIEVFAREVVAPGSIIHTYGARCRRRAQYLSPQQSFGDPRSVHAIRWMIIHPRGLLASYLRWGVSATREAVTLRTAGRPVGSRSSVSAAPMSNQASVPRCGTRISPFGADGRQPEFRVGAPRAG
jgi:hypothetical protein